MHRISYSPTRFSLSWAPIHPDATGDLVLDFHRKALRLGARVGREREYFSKRARTGKSHAGVGVAFITLLMK